MVRYIGVIHIRPEADGAGEILHMPLYFQTLSLQCSMNAPGHTPRSAPCRLSLTSSPLPAPPEVRGYPSRPYEEHIPFMVRYLGIISLITRVRTWPIWGFPLLSAVRRRTRRLSLTALSMLFSKIFCPSRISPPAFLCPQSSDLLTPSGT